MTVKKRLHQLVESLDDAEADELLEYTDWLAREMDTLTMSCPRPRLGQEAIAREDYVTLEGLKERLYRGL